MASSPKKSTSGKKSSKSSSGRRSNSTQKRKKSGSVQEFSWKSEVLLFALLAFAIVLFISEIGKAGAVGSVFAKGFFGMFGIMAYIFPFLLFFMVAFAIANFKDEYFLYRNPNILMKFVAIIILYIFLCVFAYFVRCGSDVMNPIETWKDSASSHFGGGMLGSLIGFGLIKGFSVLVGYIVDILVMVVAIVLLTQKSLFGGMSERGQKAAEAMIRRQEERKALQAERKAQAEEERRQRKEAMAEERRLERERRAEEDALRAEEADAEDLDTVEDPVSERRSERKARGVSFNTGLFGKKNTEDPELNEQILDAIRSIQEESAEGKQEKVLEDPVWSTNAEPVIHMANESKDSQVKDSISGVEYSEQGDGDEEDATRYAASYEEAAAQVKDHDRKTRISPRHAVLDDVLDLDAELDEAESGSEEIKDPYMTEEIPVDADVPVQPVENIEKAKGTRSAKRSASEVEAGVEGVANEIKKKPVVHKAYVRPLYKLLSKGDPNAVGASKKDLMEMSARLQNTLNSFDVRAHVTDVTCGPAVTQYEIQLEPGVKVSKITNLQDDIKLNLAVADIRIEAPIPGKSAIGIEVPNKENVTVAFRDLIESKEFKNHPSNIAFCAGKDIAGNVIIADIAKMPHLLIAGATGSGKSVCINTIVMSILYKADPSDVKLIMIDPKVVELSVYNGIPHLLIPVVTDPKKAAGALHWAVAEMTDRYQKFAEYGVRDVKGYNKKIESIEDIEDENKPQKMPQIVVIVDELADLMMVAPGDVEDAICRLAQLARAAGIHLVIATQRPSVNVITGLIKANMPSRIAFSVSSGVDSRTILDMNGAEKLLGKGDMLYYPQGYQKPRRVQGAFVSDKEVSDVVDFIIERNGQGGYNSDIEDKVVAQQSSIGGGSGFTESANDRDAYFAEAGKFVVEKEKGSIGMLQRMFKIGFNRAARIMDQLEEAGVVGPEEGTKPRRVLMTLEQFEQMLNEEA